MSDRQILAPDAIHPITITPNPKRVVVMAGGLVIADTTSALAMQEASYPVVQYIPLRDVDRSLLERTEHTSYCPYKGDCSYYSLPIAGDRGINAVWTYEAPYEAVAAVKDHVAFYPDRIDSIEMR